MLIVFKLPELSHSCSKWIVKMLQLSQLMINGHGEFLDLDLKSVPENSFYKSCVIKER